MSYSIRACLITFKGKCTQYIYLASTAMEYKSSKPKGRVPKRIVRAKVASRYPLVRLAPSVPKSLMSYARPPILSVKHRSRCLYNDSPAIAATGTASNAHVFTANGMYDPNITGTGHQPMGFDQLMQLYEHYTVTNAKITVSFVNTTSGESGYVGIAIFPDATVETSPSKLVENGMIKRAYLAKASGDSKSQQTLTMSTRIARVNGRPESIVGDDLFRGDVSTNPTEQSYFHVFIYNIDTVNTITARADVLIEYDAVFTEPKKLSQS